jgi:hypothetical protein
LGNPGDVHESAVQIDPVPANLFAQIRQWHSTVEIQQTKLLLFVMVQSSVAVVAVYRKN